MAVLFSSPSIVIQLRNFPSTAPPMVKVLAFSKRVSLNPLNFKAASISMGRLPSFTINAYQSESTANELQPKRIVSPTMPEDDNFKEPEPGRQSLEFVEAKKSGAPASKEKVATQTSMDYQQVLKYPLVTESAIKKIIEENTLVFMVDVRANKKDIRNAFEQMLHIKTKKINTLINYDGTKKAYIQLSPDNEAVTVAKKLKILA